MLDDKILALIDLKGLKKHLLEEGCEIRSDDDLKDALTRAISLMSVNFRPMPKRQDLEEKFVVQELIPRTMSRTIRPLFVKRRCLCIPILGKNGYAVTDRHATRWWQGRLYTPVRWVKDDPKDLPEIASEIRLLAEIVEKEEETATIFSPMEIFKRMPQALKYRSGAYAYAQLREIKEGSERDIIEFSGTSHRISLGAFPVETDALANHMLFLSRGGPTAKLRTTKGRCAVWNDVVRIIFKKALTQGGSAVK